MSEAGAQTLPDGEVYDAGDPKHVKDERTRRRLEQQREEEEQRKAIEHVMASKPGRKFVAMVLMALDSGQTISVGHALKTEHNAALRDASDGLRRMLLQHSKEGFLRMQRECEETIR